MSTRSRFFDSVAGDRIYGSDAFADIFRAFGTDTVIVGYQDEMKVVPSSPAAMSVRVSLGAAFVQGRFFEVYTGLETVAIAAAHATLNRIDTVVLRVNYTTRLMELAVLTGTAASSPSPAALTQSGSVWEMALAYVHVAPTITSITAIRIADARNLRFPRWGQLDGKRQLLAFFEGIQAYAVTSSSDGLVLWNNPSNGGGLASTGISDADRIGGALGPFAITTAGNNGGISSNSSVFAGDHNPRARMRSKYVTNVAAGYSVFGFVDDGMTTADASALVTGTTRDLVGIVRTDNGNLFFRTVNAGGAATSTDMGAANTSYGVWEIRSDNDGLSWECYLDGTLKARHTTNLPTVTNLLQFAHIVETATTTQFNGPTTDYIYVDQDRE
jgi:hypothetical protein